MPAGSVPESSSARQFVEESATTPGGVEGGEQLATTANESAAMLGATAGAIGSSEAEARVADTAPKSGAEKPMVLEE